MTAGEVRGSAINAIDDLFGSPTPPAAEPQPAGRTRAEPQPADPTPTAPTRQRNPGRQRPEQSAPAAGDLPPGLEPEEPKKVQTGTYLYEPTALRLNAFIAKMKAQGKNVTKLRIVDAAIQAYLNTYDTED